LNLVVKSSSGFQLVLPDKPELLKKGTKFIFRLVTERTVENSRCR